MQFGHLVSNARRWGAITAPKISRFGHTASSFLQKAGGAGHMLAVKGGQVVDFLDKSPLGANPEAAAILGGARGLLRTVGAGANLAARTGSQAERALQAYGGQYTTLGNVGLHTAPRASWTEAVPSVRRAKRTAVNTFELATVDAATGANLNMITVAPWQANILLTKGGQIVNEGLYEFSANGTITKP